MLFVISAYLERSEWYNGVIIEKREHRKNGGQTTTFGGIQDDAPYAFFQLGALQWDYSCLE